jgi:hypothetical protein
VRAQVVYTDRTDWFAEAMSLLPTLATVALFLYVSRKLGDRMGGMGGGGSGGRGIFGVGKASITSLDQTVRARSLSRPLLESPHEPLGGLRSIGFPSTGCFD